MNHLIWISTVCKFNNFHFAVIRVKILVYFQALNPGWALFLLYGMKDFPRTMFVYLYFFEYETMFVPFIHVVCPMSENAPRYDFSSTVSSFQN